MALEFEKSQLFENSYRHLTNLERIQLILFTAPARGDSYEF